MKKNNLNYCMSIFFFILLAFSSPINAQSNSDQLLPTSVIFKTTDSTLQRLYNKAEAEAKNNIIVYGNRKVMKEGGQYVSLWLETQPMAGAMYAKRNLEVATNNIQIFMDYQRNDGRLPGVIYNRNSKIEPNYAQFQGVYFPMPAFELFYWLDKDSTYLNTLYNALEQCDAYMWKTRDSDNNGCLETWCIFDNGEDHSIRFNGYPKAWGYDFPPSKTFLSKLSKEELQTNCKQNSIDTSLDIVVPIESMDMMSYSYSCRDVLALISKELKNSKEDYWRRKANEVQIKIKDYLWDDNSKACFDKDKNNKTLPTLLHNNLRCMYFGSFTSEMADDFIHYHLMNRKEFWTPMPLPSIAANDSSFRNISGNNWSGQPQGLTFQRSISAMENYGHYAELSLIGQTFLNALSDSMRFTQQFDPFTKKSDQTKDGYGPSILTTLEFISRFYGIHISRDTINWSCLDTKQDFEYTQVWNKNTYLIKKNREMVSCFINSKLIVQFSKGCRLVTDMNGKPLKIIGIETKDETIKFLVDKNSTSLTVKPNFVYKLNDNKTELISSKTFFQPN